jgi:tRNA(fMet)-specific endonuclease VapC
MRYMLDTDTSSYIIKGGYGPVERHLARSSPSDICISAMTRAELLYGLKSLSQRHHLHQAVHRFLKVTSMLPWDAESADFFAEIKHQLRSGGTPAHAIAADATLVTNNTRHFKRIRLPLMLANWME